MAVIPAIIALVLIYLTGSVWIGVGVPVLLLGVWFLAGLVIARNCRREFAKRRR